MNRLLAGAAAAAAAVSMNVQAQDNFPNRPVRIVVPFSAGSATDILARAVAARLTEAWGQQVLSDNRPGALGIIGTEMMLKANPDGHTMLMVSSGHAANATLAAKLPPQASNAADENLERTTPAGVVRIRRRWTRQPPPAGVVRAPTDSASPACVSERHPPPWAMSPPSCMSVRPRRS
jgi:hypothetical protein